MTPEQIDALNKSLKDLVSEIKKDRQASQSTNPDGTPRASSFRGPTASSGDAPDPGGVQERKLKQLQQERDHHQEILDLQLLEKAELETLHDEQIAYEETLEKQIEKLKDQTGLTEDQKKANQELLLQAQEQQNLLDQQIKLINFFILN